MIRSQRLSLLLVTVLFFVAAVGARAEISTDPAESFFTNIAQRILNTMAADFAPVTNVNAIMLWPSNHYGNGMHRVMQQAANIYEATRTNPFPAVFRPLFGNCGTNICIVGWTNDNNPDTLGGWLAQNQFATSLVIGARKGFPNFNELSLRTDMLVARKLQLRRPSVNSLPNQTNQMYIVGISNTVAVESWNSYYKPFTFDSIIEVSNSLTLTITNRLGTAAASTASASTLTNIADGTWTGWNGAGANARPSFKLPLFTNLVMFSNLVYVAAQNSFQPIATNTFELLPNPFYLPDWKLVCSNTFVYIHRCGTNLIDFVILNDVAVTDLSSNLLTTALSPPSAVGNMWDTNRSFGSSGPFEGLRAQISFSQFTGTDSDWNSYGTFNGSYQGINNDRVHAAAAFRDFLGGRTNAPLTTETPFNPVARFLRTAVWQANDPLVHYHPADLAFYPSVTVDGVKWREANLQNFGARSLTNVNRVYAPWGNEGGTDPRSLDSRLRDPLVWLSDDWNFPTNLNATALGRVHRGTPWQTIYLKAGAAPLTDWRSQANSLQNHPTNDWRLASALAPLFSTADPSKLFPINSNSRSQWTSNLVGLTFITNILDDDSVLDPFYMGPRFASGVLVEGDAGLSNVIDAIALTRSAQPRGFFTDIGAILATPELTDESPWLNRSDNQRAAGISDEAYEILAAQLLARLRIEPIMTATRSSGSNVLQITGCEGCVYQLQSSTDLQNWNDLGVPQTATTGVIVLPVDDTIGTRFFRVQELR